MPSKTCPQCQAVHGARKLVCDCGHDFGCKRTDKAAIQQSVSPPTGEPIKPAAPAPSAPLAPSAPPVPPADLAGEPARRGKKICPKCGVEHGARKLACECGHDFGCKRTGKAAVRAGDTSHPLYPEPGGWVADKMKGLPDIVPPEPLPRGPVSASIVKEITSYEGLGYSIYSYIPAKRISDPELRKLWGEARAAMQRVVEHLEGVSFPK